MKSTGDACGCFPSGRHYPGIAHLLGVQTLGVVPELEAAAAWLELPVVLIDVETTGRDSANDRIVEIALVRGRGDAIERVDSWLVNPGVPIPKEASDVHHISDEMVADAPPFSAIAAEVVRALEGAVPGAYNAGFDRGFVRAELVRAGVDEGAMGAALQAGVEWLDPLVWARELQKYERGKSLGDVCGRLGIEIGSAHRAADDAAAALKVMVALSRDVRVPKPYGAMIAEQKRLSRKQDEERAQWRDRRGG